MISRPEFAEKIANLDLSHAGRAIALLWYYRRSEEYEERTSSELADDLQEEDFARPHVTRLHRALQEAEQVVAGRRSRSFRINLQYLGELNEQYGHLLEADEVEIEDEVLPNEWVVGTRGYLEDMARQINGSYQFGFYDCTAVLCRRMMESLIIEVYIFRDRHQEIQAQGEFFGLDRLINHIVGDNQIALGRSMPAAMRAIKEAGDTAAHDRYYITHRIDIETIRPNVRRIIRTLLALCNILP